MSYAARPTLVHFLPAALCFLLLICTAPVFETSGAASAGRTVLTLIFVGIWAMQRKAFFRAWRTLPPLALLSAMLWLTFLGVAVFSSPMPRVTGENALLQLWPLLIAAFVYASSLQEPHGLQVVRSSLLWLTNLVLLLCLFGQRTAFFGNDVYFVLCLAPLLPLAFDEARQQPTLWRRLRPYACCIALLTALPSLTALRGFENIWLPVRALNAAWPANGPGTMPFFLPQFLSPTAPRLPDGIAPGWFVQTFSEQGALALGCWLLYIASLLIGPKNENPQLQNAARSGAGLFLVLTIFVSPAGALLPQIVFYALLAIAAAQTPRVASRQSAVLTALLLVAALSFGLWRLPQAVREARAQWFYEQSFRSAEREAQLKLIARALRDDPAQSAYWIRLAEIRLQHDGAPASRAALSYLRAALHRAMPNGESPDAATWHRMAQLCLDSGDVQRGAQLAQKAVRYDPSCAKYRATLAEALKQTGDASGATREAALAAQLQNNAPAHSPRRYRRLHGAD